MNMDNMTTGLNVGKIVLPLTVGCFNYALILKFQDVLGIKISGIVSIIYFLTWKPST